MREPDFGPFSSMLDDVATVLPPQQPLSSTGKAMFFRSVSHLALDQVRRALDAHVRDPQRGRFFPKPADLLAQVNDGRPGADEAWAIAVQGNDESATIVWTDEMAQAWGVARPVMQLGDEVGARVAFRDAYNRLTSESRAQGRAVQWMPSLGHDIERRHNALHEAAVLGRLPAGEVAGYLPAPAAGGMPERVRAHLAKLRFDLTQTGPAAVEPSDDGQAKQATDVLKAQSARRVRDYAAKFGLTLGQSETLLRREGGRS